MSHEADGLRAGKYPVLSTGRLTIHLFHDRQHGLMDRYDLTVVHPDTGAVLVSVLTRHGDITWSKKRPEEELRLFRCYARFPVPDPNDESGEWRVATFTFDVTSGAGNHAGTLDLTDETTTFDFNREIAA